MEGLRLIKAGDNQGWQCGAAPLRARSAIVLWGGEGGGGFDNRDHVGGSLAHIQVELERVLDAE